MCRGGIYIHVPFCHAKCYYCDFYSLTATEQLKDEWLDAVIAELTLRRSELAGNPVTVYIGGGTPSSLGVGRLRRLLAALPLDEAVEVTVEANPEDVNRDWAEMMVECGVNRVSMGVQSLTDSELLAIGRRHDAARAIAAFNDLREAGIGNISLDLIYGLPGQTRDSWLRSLDGVMELRPEHLSAYSLMYEEGTHLTSLMRQGRVTPAEDDDVEWMYDSLCRLAAAAGYEHYEISNFSLPGYRARHNSSYWVMAPYLGLGPGAHSFDGVSVRRANPSSLRRWLAAIGEGRPAYEEEHEDRRTLHNDMVMTALRTAEGLPLTPEALCIAAPYLTDGRMERFTAIDGKERLRISERAWLTSDPMIADFITV